MVRRYRRVRLPTKMRCSRGWRYRMSSGSQPLTWP